MTMVCLLMCLASYSSYGDLQPRFPGGEEALMAFIEKEMKYPDESVKYGEQGRVVIEFTVDKKGIVVNSRVIRTATPLLDREALRIISKMPRWKPAKMLNGKTAEHWWTIVIYFDFTPIG
jgi:protein TonB